MRKFILITLILLSAGCGTSQQGPTPELVLKGGGLERRFTRDELLRSPHLKSVVVQKDPAYQGRMTVYKAVPASVLFDGLPAHENGSMLFRCLDGFSAPISATRLLAVDSNESRAYIAIEPANDRWPALKPDSPQSAGPFYLIWEHPEKSKIVTEEWPFQLVAFEAQLPPELQFPATAPAREHDKHSPVWRGYMAFIQNCFACHTMNKEGTSQIGPDLNWPFNPTEYFKAGYLEKIIRDPQSVRHWPQSKMAGVDASVLSDKDLKALVQYLQHMSEQKARRAGAGD
jgi:mono/diheme cytochrome c family protein